MPQEGSMPEEQEQAAPEPQEGGEAETFTAEYVAKLRKEAAKYRTEAKANAEAATKLAELEEANKSEIQKAADRAAAAERERDAAFAEAMRWKVAAKHGISDEDAELFLTGTDEETLTKQAERLAQRTSDRKKNGNVVPKEGTTPREPADDPMRAFTRQLFNAGD